MSDDPPTADSPPPSIAVAGTGNREIVVLGLLGLNAWIVVGLIPLVSVGGGSSQEWLQVAAPLLVLTGCLAGAARGWPFAHLLLLATFPPAIGLAMTARGELLLRDAYDALTITLGALSVVAFVARAAQAATRARSLKPAQAHPLRSKQPVGEPPSRRWLRRTLLATVAIAGLMMIVVVPAWPSFSERTVIWGESAQDGSVLTVLVAALVASLAIGAVVGPGLRAERRVKPTRGRRRLVTALLVGSLSAGLFCVLTYLDQLP